MYNKNLLVVDDTEINIDILLELLSDNYEITVALDGVSALEIVEEEHIDLILLDIMMPDMDGYEVCKKLKSDPKTKDIPVVFITAKIDEDSIEKAYDVGGIDYVTKPFKPKELLARIKTQLTMQELIKKLEATHKELELLASIDPMTKLYNRRYFQTTAENILDLAKRDDKHLSILMLDIDKFKRINDTYGHPVGDQVIIHLANKLIQHQRKSDVICRFGGEEFLILLPNTSIDGAKIVSEKIRSDIEQSDITLEDGSKLNFTVSIGVAIIDTKNDDNIEISIQKADNALYKAKESGRNRVCYE